MNFRFVGNAETVENIAIFYPKSFTTFSISVSYKNVIMMVLGLDK